MKNGSELLMNIRSSLEQESAFLEKANKTVAGFCIAFLTDAFFIDEWPLKRYTLNGQESKLLEIRIFNEETEWKLFRSDIGSTFSERILDDAIQKRDYFDVVQRLDVDLLKTRDAEDGIIVSTGGGHYVLPFYPGKRAAAVIRYYIECYKASGQARIADWRVVRLEEAHG